MQHFYNALHRGVELSHLVDETATFFFKHLGVLKLLWVQNTNAALIIERNLHAIVFVHHGSGERASLLVAHTHERGREACSRLSAREAPRHSSFRLIIPTIPRAVA